MKVACIGNMNNMLFSLTRYLRDRGVDAELLIPANELNGLDHFLPENDSFDDSYKSFTRMLTWGGGGRDIFRNTSAAHIKEDLKEYDFFIVSGTSVPYLYKAGIKIDVFFPHGSDIKYVPFKGEAMSILQKIRNRTSYLFFEYHKMGLKDTSVINIDHSDPFWDDPIQKLGLGGNTQYFACPMVYHSIYSRSDIQPYYSSIKNIDLYRRIRNENDLVIVNHAAQEWVGTMNANGVVSKGSDVVIRGFASFLKQKPTSYRTKLILFEYGMDVNASKTLIEELGLKNDVVWHQKASRKEIMALLSLADFTCGEFKPGCIGGNTTWEALVSGSCLLHYLNTTFTKFDGFLDEPYPFVNVNTPEGISKVFSSFVKEPDKYREIGSEGNKWYLKYFAGKSVDRYVELIDAKQSITTKSIIAA